MLNTNFVPQLATLSQSPDPSTIPLYVPVISVSVIRAHSLAHAEFSPAVPAAWLWVDGRALFVPTVELAARTFGVSRQLIRQERWPNYSAALGLSSTAGRSVRKPNAPISAPHTSSESGLRRARDRSPTLIAKKGDENE